MIVASAVFSSKRYSCATIFLAYMSVETGSDGIIDNFSYSSYPSSGSSYGDIFSRPMNYCDRKNEVFDMLLHILGQYTEEGYRNL